MKNWKNSILLAIALALMSNALAAHAQPPQPPTNSVKSSPSSDTRVSKQSAVGSRQQEDVAAACSAAADELKASRVLIAAIDAENASLKTRLATEKQLTSLLTELNETRRSESDALRIALTAKNETIAAKDVAIASQDKLIDALKRKKPSPWRRLGDILIGAATIAVLK